MCLQMWLTTISTKPQDFRARSTHGQRAGRGLASQQHAPGPWRPCPAALARALRLWGRAAGISPPGNEAAPP